MVLLDPGWGSSFELIVSKVIGLVERRCRNVRLAQLWEPDRDAELGKTNVPALLGARSNGARYIRASAASPTEELRESGRLRRDRGRFFANPGEFGAVNAVGACGFLQNGRMRRF
ncbi:hypothetical protein, partial [Glaciihabitans sp. dw_435]|uniref:hypothetical protein n=1 Tax=Glaciihabitans sp. dw_435 TaxID=2720081 RepID=UPI001BD293AC